MTRKSPRAALAATLLACALLAPPAASGAEGKPWWQVLSGSRPSHLPSVGKAETQEVRSAKVGGNVAVSIEVGGKAIGCLGAGALAGTFCGEAPIETAAQLQEALQAPYGAGEVEVQGGPVGSETPLTVTTEERWVPAIVLAPPLLSEKKIGNVSAEVTSAGSGTLSITATNLGDGAAQGSTDPIAVTDTLPEGLEAYGVFAPVAGAKGLAGPLKCVQPDTRQLTCTFKGALPSYEAIEIDVLVARTGPLGEAGEVTVSGGGAAAAGHVVQTVDPSEAPVPFGLELFEAKPEAEGGAASPGAGVRPFQLTTTLQFNAGRLSGANRGPESADVEVPALPRNTRVRFPVGLAGSAIATPTCPLADFLHKNSSFPPNDCPPASAVGVASVTVIERKAFGFLRYAVPIFNLPPAYGEPARFGFMPAGTPVVIDTSVDPEDQYRVTGEVRNAPQIAKVLSATLSLWGAPAIPATTPRAAGAASSAPPPRPAPPPPRARPPSCAPPSPAPPGPPSKPRPNPGTRRSAPWSRARARCSTRRAAATGCPSSPRSPRRSPQGPPRAPRALTSSWDCPTSGPPKASPKPSPARWKWRCPKG